MPCNWPVDRSCLPALPLEYEDDYCAKVAALEAAEDMAVQVLWALSGRQFGACPALARPCPANPVTLRFTGMSHAPWLPVYWGGQWLNLTCGCGERCEVTGPRVVHLPGPVSEIVTVTIGDEVLAEDGYALEGGALYRKGANWPSQDLGRPLGEDGTWSVEYLRGLPPPAGAGAMTGLLAKEFLAACSDEKCRLPRNVTGVNRNGVSYQIYDPATLMRSGKTGLSEVDLWLSAINPYALAAAPTVI